MKLLITCGPGLESREDADILVVDWDTKEIIDHFNTKQTVFPVSPKGFAGAIYDGLHLVVTSEVELFKFDLNPLTLVKRVSDKSLNDAHFILPYKNQYYVCNSGMDTIEVFDKEFGHVDTIFLLEKYSLSLGKKVRLLKDDLRRFLDRLSGGYKHYSHLEYKPRLKIIRKLLDQRGFYKSQSDKRLSEYRPHILHPNCLVEHNDEIWVTMFSPGVVLSLNTGEIIAGGLNRPHDGVIDGDTIVMTECQTNKIVVAPLPESVGADKAARIVDATSDLAEGFLRGLVITEDSFFCGLSVRRIPTACKKARVIQVDKQTGGRLSEWEVPEKYGQQVYTVLDVTQHYQ